jgi:hypothetical protein
MVIKRKRMIWKFELVSPLEYCLTTIVKNTRRMMKVMMIMVKKRMVIQTTWSTVDKRKKHEKRGRKPIVTVIRLRAITLLYIWALMGKKVKEAVSYYS